jgi:hypothetical protein
MWLEVATPIAAGIGSAVAAGISGFRLARGRLSSEDRTAYVRLSAEDSDRVEKINALLERLINLEEQTQEGVTRLAEQVTKVRLDHARRDGFLSGRIDALARPDG